MYQSTNKRFNLSNIKVNINVEIETEKVAEDKEIMDKVMVKYIPLIKSEANINSQFNEDLFQYLLENMYVNLKKYDTSKNVKLITFITNYIKYFKYDYISNKKSFSLDRAEMVSLNEYAQEGIEVGELIIDESVNIEESTVEKETVKYIKDVLQDIKGGELFWDYYYNNMTFAEVGYKHNKTTQGAKYIIDKVQSQLKNRIVV